MDISLFFLQCYRAKDLAFRTDLSEAAGRH